MTHEIRQKEVAVTALQKFINKQIIEKQGQTEVIMRVKT